MRTRTSERGASIWPFVISLVLLLIFVFLWFDRKSEGEKFEKKAAELQTQVDAANAQLGELDTYASDLSELVGWKAPNAKLSKHELTDLAALKATLDLNDPKGLFATFRDASTQAVARQFYKGTASAPPPAIDISKISQAFKDKIDEINKAMPGAAPIPPADWDDAAAKKEFEEAKQKYDAAFEAYKKLVDEALAMKDFEAIKPVLGSVSLWSVDKMGDAVKWQFVAQPAVPSLTLEEYVKLPSPAITKMKEEWMKSVNSLVAQIDALTKEKAERDGTIERIQAELATAQTDRTNDVAKLQKEASDAKEIAEKSRVDLENQRNLLSQATDKAKVDAAAANTAITALKNRIQSDKEVIDAEIARDDADGSILGANNSQSLVYVNLGTADKVTAGMKFAVWNVGGGGFRVQKGWVVITQVIEPHYSQARIASSTAKLSTGDSISNPFFRKDRPIRLYLAGDLKKYPKAIAAERLKRMNVIVEDTISAETDYVLIPSGIVVAPAGAAPAADGAAAPATETEYDKLQKLARSFGANLITETQISAFLDY